MAKVTNMRERVHQPFRDSLARTSGFYQGTVQDNTTLFQDTGGTDAARNVKTGSVLPSDQSMVILALRVFLWFRHSTARSVPDISAATNPTIQSNGDYFITGATQANAVNAMAGSGVGNTQDVYRLYWQASEQLLWSFGAGDKMSLKSMPSSYFPWGGGLHGDCGGQTDLIHFNNGTPDHSGILRLGRAVTLPPRQNILCTAQIVRLPDGGNSTTFGATQGSRNMLNLVDNLNACDLINKCIAFCFDGLWSRDVQ